VVRSRRKRRHGRRELEAAQRYLTGAYPLRFDGNGRIAGILAGMQADGMPVDYIATRNDRVMP
jgi:zinc protease